MASGPIGAVEAMKRTVSLWYNQSVPSGSNSAVECDLAKVEVAGSNPVSRSIVCSETPRGPARDPPRFGRGFCSWGDLFKPGAVPKLSRFAGVKEPSAAEASWEPTGEIPSAARDLCSIFLNQARYPSGKGEVCKTFIRGFDSHPRLQLLLAAS